MPNDDRPLVDTFTNVDWLNAVRNEAGVDYQSRVPEATQANVQDVIQNLWNYRANMNQFIDVLINRIGLVLFAEWSWANPLAPLKRGMLNYGETIEEIMVGLVEADEYDADRDELEKEIFGAMTPEVQASYHTVNRRNRYKMTIKEPLLRNAFLNENGLSSFIAQLLGSVQKSDQFDEYLLMARLFKEMDQAALQPDGTSGLFNIAIDDIGAEGSNEAQNKYALRRMREMGTELQFPSRLYNPAGMHQAVNPDDLILFTTPQADAAMDVEALAGAFNIQKAEFASRRFVLPMQHFGIPGFQAAITTKEFFVVADQRIDTTTQANPAALFTNYWLHHWQVVSASRFAPIVMFNSERPSTVIATTEYAVTGITPFVITDSDGNAEATTLTRGELFNVAVSAETTPAGGPGISVRLYVEGKKSAFTRISNNGSLYVAPDETADVLTIRAIAVDSNDVPQYSETTTRTVSGTLIKPWPHPEVIEDADADSVEETTPVKPTFETPDKIIVPNSERVEYRDGATPVNGQTLTITGASGTTKTITAVAKAGWEIKPGATASWVFTKA